MSLSPEQLATLRQSSSRIFIYAYVLGHHRVPGGQQLLDLLGAYDLALQRQQKIAADVLSKAIWRRKRGTVFEWCIVAETFLATDYRGQALKRLREIPQHPFDCHKVATILEEAREEKAAYDLRRRAVRNVKNARHAIVLWSNSEKYRQKALLWRFRRFSWDAKVLRDLSLKSLPLYIAKDILNKAGRAMKKFDEVYDVIMCQRETLCELPKTATRMLNIALRLANTKEQCARVWSATLTFECPGVKQAAQRKLCTFLRTFEEWSSLLVPDFGLDQDRIIRELRSRAQTVHEWMKIAGLTKDPADIDRLRSIASIDDWVAVRPHDLLMDIQLEILEHEQRA